MPFLSYAQNFEDVILWRALQHVGTGSYIDIGGQDPVVDSVSKAFSLRGWRGIHVEASPGYAEALRLDRPDDEVIEAAVGTATGPITLYFIPGTGLSTGVAEIAEHHRSQGYDIQPIEVPVIALSQIFESAPWQDIHWLKIDVEGMEADVLASWGTSDVRPWVLVIEATFPNTQNPTHSDWISRVNELGYHQVYFDGLSRYFVSDKHRELDEFFSSPPNVFDGFQIASHHFAARELVQAHLLRQAEIEIVAHENEKAYAQALDVHHGLTKEIEDLRGTVGAAEKSIEQYRDQLRSATKKQEQLVNEIQHSNREWLGRLDVANAQISTLAAAGREDRERTRLLEKLLADDRQALLELQRDSDKAILDLSLQRERALTVLRERNLSWDKRFEDLDAQLNEARSVIRDLENTLQLERSQAAERLKIASAAIAKFDDHKEEDQRLILSLREREAQLQRRLEDALTQHDAIVANLRDDYTAALRAERASFADAEKIRHALATALEENRVAKEALAADLRAITQESEERKAEISKKADFIDRLEADKIAAAQERSRLIAELDTLNKAMGDAFLWQTELQLALNARRKKGYWGRIKDAFLCSNDDEFSRFENHCFAKQQSSQQSLSHEITLMQKVSPLTDISNLDHTQPALSVDDICQFDGENFLTCAFISILGRMPDGDGRLYYLERLRSGWSKRSILAQLRRSEEGRLFDANVAGLNAILSRERWRRIPVVKRFIRDREDSASSRNQRAIQIQLAALAERVAKVDLAINDESFSNRTQSTQDDFTKSLNQLSAKLDFVSRNLLLLQDSIYLSEKKLQSLIHAQSENNDSNKKDMGEILRFIGMQTDMTVEDIMSLAH